MRKITLPNFYTNVATAGTAVPLLAVDAPGLKVRGPASILITARKDKTTANTGNIYVGGRLAQSEVLEPGDRFVLDVGETEEISLNDLFIDAATNGDGAAVTVKQS